MTNIQRISFREVAAAALRVRLKIPIKWNQPVNPYTVCQQLGIEVRFIDVPTLEGMYHRGTNPLVLISSLRPSGRKSSTCGHELGHHILGHGTSIDEMSGEEDNVKTQDAEEHAADVFSSFLRMPPKLMRFVFSKLSQNGQIPIPSELYSCSCYLDVSYSGLITHLCSNLRMLTWRSYRSLLGEKLSVLREQILGVSINGARIFEIPNRFDFSVIYAETGDLLRISDCYSTDLLRFCVKEQPGKYEIWRCKHAGTFRIDTKRGVSILVKIRKSDFTGRAQFQYMEDPDDVKSG